MRAIDINGLQKAKFTEKKAKPSRRILSPEYVQNFIWKNLSFYAPVSAVCPLKIEKTIILNTPFEQLVALRLYAVKEMLALGNLSLESACRIMQETVELDEKQVMAGNWHTLQRQFIDSAINYSTCKDALMGHLGSDQSPEQAYLWMEFYLRRGELGIRRTIEDFQAFENQLKIFTLSPQEVSSALSASALDHDLTPLALRSKSQAERVAIMARLVDSLAYPAESQLSRKLRVLGYLAKYQEIRQNSSLADKLLAFARKENNEKIIALIFNVFAQLDQSPQVQKFIEEKIRDPKVAVRIAAAYALQGAGDIRSAAACLMRDEYQKIHRLGKEAKAALLMTASNASESSSKAAIYFLSGKRFVSDRSVQVALDSILMDVNPSNPGRRMACLEALAEYRSATPALLKRIKGLYQQAKAVGRLGIAGLSARVLLRHQAFEGKDEKRQLKAYILASRENYSLLHLEGLSAMPAVMSVWGRAQAKFLFLIYRIIEVEGYNRVRDYLITAHNRLNDPPAGMINHKAMTIMSIIKTLVKPGDQKVIKFFAKLLHDNDSEDLLKELARIAVPNKTAQTIVRKLLQEAFEDFYSFGSVFITLGLQVYLKLRSPKDQSDIQFLEQWTSYLGNSSHTDEKDKAIFEQIEKILNTRVK